MDGARRGCITGEKEADTRYSVAMLCGSIGCAASLWVGVAGARPSVTPASGMVVEQVSRPSRQGQAWLVVSDLSGAGRRPLTRPVTGGEQRVDGHASWSSDGSRVAFGRWTPKELTVMVVNADGTGLHRVATLGRRSGDLEGIGEISWSPDGESLAFVGPTVGYLEGIYWASAGGAGQRLLVRVRHKPEGFLDLFGWDPDGSLVTYAFAYGERKIEQYIGPALVKTVARDGSNVRLRAKEDSVVDAGWSPDGSLLAYTRNCAADVCQLVVLDPAMGRRRALTHFKHSFDLNTWDSLPFSWGADDTIIYTRSRMVYAASASTGDTRMVRAMPCLENRCAGPPQEGSTETDILAVTSDGRYALVDEEDLITLRSADYWIDLDSGALSRMRDDLAYSAIYLP